MDASERSERSGSILAGGAQNIAKGSHNLAKGGARFIGGAARQVGGGVVGVAGGAAKMGMQVGGQVVGGVGGVVGRGVGGVVRPVDQLSTLMAGLNRQDGNFSRWMTKTLQKTVLKPDYYLRKQLFLSFGTTATAAISFFIFIGIITAKLSGESVMNEAKLVQEQLATYTLGTSARYVAETITKKFHNFQTASDILMEATRDRIVGYKSPYFFDNELVPFEDYDTGQRMYPLDTPDLIKMDWESESNLQNPVDAEIHLQGRDKWFDPDLQVTTAHAAWFQAGSCNPNALFPSDPAYMPNCTAASNNLRQPQNRNNWPIYNRAKDLVFLLKALYESHPVAKQIGIYFANGGAGSYVKFPSHIRDGRQTFRSIGCEWGDEINTLSKTRQRFLNADERRRCHQIPGDYPSREYNPLERSWCMRQALAPAGKPVTTGPYLDASASQAQDLWVLTFGHGVFDRIAGEFIGCTLVDVSVGDLQETLNNFQIGSSSAIALVRWDDDESNRAGAVVACGQCHLNETRQNHITELQEDFGIDVDLWKEMLQWVDYDTEWNADEVKKVYEETLVETNNNGRLVMMYPVDYLPNEYDPNYSPSFMVIVSISEEEIYGDSEEMNKVVRRDILEVILAISLVGAIGLVVIFAVLTWISRTLTKPLLWMQHSTAQVINNAGSESLVAGVSPSSGSGMGPSSGLAQCSPKTEVTVLRSEFEMMMDGFSGKGAAEIADSNVSEVQNNFQWREPYQVLYPYNFRTGGLDDNDEEHKDMHPGSVIDLASVRSVKSELTIMSALSLLSELSVVQAITKPYNDLTASLSKSIAELATNSYTAGMEKLPGWAQNILLKDDDSDDMPDYVVSPPFVNRLKNLRNHTEEDDIRKKSIEVSSSSKVFLWVSFGIQIPLLLTASAVITLNEIWIRSNLEKWLSDVRTASFLLEQDAIVTATMARAVFGEEVMARFMRDLHLYSRTAAWLLFGAVTRSTSFTKMRTGGDQCKHYPKGEEPICPYIESTPCACEWDDNYATEETCQDYDPYGLDSSRYDQTGSREGHALDFDPLTGNRPRKPNRTVEYDDPANSFWWDSVEEMPGSNKSSSAAGFDTTYDRVRVLSALAAIEFPMYNYYPGRGESVHLGSYVGIEADGMMIGYSGCDGSNANYPWWQSTDGNKAYELAPELCPKGSYGYDCRCRGWFAQAAVNDTYISPPYAFAGSSTVGTTAASAIKDTRTSELVAVVGLDFLPEAFTNALGPDRTVIGDGDTGFAFVITPDVDINGGNTIFGPDYDVTQGAKSIAEVIQDEVFPGYKNQITNLKKYNYTINQMTRGKTGNTTFTRGDDDDDDARRIFVAYAPVHVDILRPLDNRDFAEGCAASRKLVYSLGIAVDERDLYLRYEGVENRVDSQLNIARGISIFAMVLTFMFVMMLTYYISLNITRPIIALTMIVKSIKNKSLRDEIPDVQGGSREVSFVHQSFQRLMKVVRFANTAFFAGDRTESYHSMEDALNLFSKLGNQKAIGVANNNLGTMVLQEQMESHGTGRLFDNSLFGICISEIYNVGITYFDEAIRHGSFEYEISKGTDDQGSYAKQLGNRFFNRGMFLVVVRHHPLCPSWITEDGVSDLLRAKDLDLEVRQFLHKHDLFKENEVLEFESLVRRTRGILALVRNYGFKDPWGIDSLIEQAQILLNEANDLTSNLFKSMSRVGRTQQLDDLRIQNALCKGDHFTAGKIAMRMLVEDQYIIDTIIVNALTAVKQYYEIEGINIPRINATQYLQRETRKAQVNVLQEAKNVFFCLDYSGSMAGERMERANKNLLWVYEEHCSDKDMVGFIRFNHDIDEKLWFPLGKKGTWSQVQEAVLKLAVDAEGGTRLYAALNRCVTQILKTETKNDTWIIALTDGESSWDHPAKSVVERIKKSNKKSENKIHVIIIGFEVPDSVIKTCEGVTNVTEKSVYVDARGGLDEMDKAFEQVVSVIGGSAVTMETF